MGGNIGHSSLVIQPVTRCGGYRAEASPGVDGRKGLRLQFNSRQSSTVNTSIPFSAWHFEYSTEYSTYIPCQRTAIGWPTDDSGAWAEASQD
eukprot:1188312-Prorocentrum_minimum.AAC.1